MGLGTWKEEEIQILSEKGELSVKELQERFGNPDYNVDRKVYRNTKWNKLDALLKPFQKKPYVVETDCRKCGICVEACPVDGKAIHFSNGRKQPPVYDYKNVFVVSAVRKCAPPTPSKPSNHTRKES